MMPAARAFANAATRASAGSVHGDVLNVSAEPRLMLIARMLYVACCEITKLIAATCVEVLELSPLNTSRPRSFTSGATPATIPDTFVPWKPAAGSSRSPSSGAKSCATTTLHPGVPGDEQLPNAARV